MEIVTQYVDVEELATNTISYVPRLLIAIAIMFTFWVAFRVMQRPMRATFKRTGLHDKLIDLLVGGVIRYTMFVFGLVMALSQLGVNVGAAVAGLGVAGIAVGLAAQDTLSNTIAGFTIFWDKPFIVGDWITVAGEYGRVTDITLRSTRIRTPRNSYVVIPNKRIIDEVLENDTKHGELRLDIPIGIAYKEDTVAAREALLDAVATVDGVLGSPNPSVVVTACGSSSVDLMVRIWIHDSGDRQPIYFATMEAAKRGLDAAGIQIPYPHLQLFWDDVEPRVVEKLRPLAGGEPAA
jgi:small conductance mechanosensitive channel